MRLIECYIENFGKICKQSFTFKEGLNCFLRDNGEGKTTLCAFIKAMLFGLEDTKKVSLYENDRRRYLPWQGGRCGGYLVFSADGRSYRIERTFAPKAADDTFALYDVKTGLPCSDYSEKIGEELFKIDADGFERTVFLSERNLSVKSDNRTIAAKLSDLVGTDGDIGVMDEALKSLEEQRKFYLKRGGSGKISDLHGKITGCELRLGELEKIEAEGVALEREIEKIRGEMTKLSDEAASLMQKRGQAMVERAGAADAERYKRMQGELDLLVRRKDELIEFFGGEAPTYAEIDEASLGYLRAKQLSDSAESEKRELEEFAQLERIFASRVGKIPSHIEVKAAYEKRSEKRTKAGEGEQKLKRLFPLRTPDKNEVEAAVASGAAKGGSVKLRGLAIAAILIIFGIVGGVLISPILYTAVALGAVAAGISLIGGGRRAGTDGFFLSVCGTVPPVDEQIKILLEMRSALEDMDESKEEVEDAADVFERELADCDEPMDTLIKMYERYERLGTAAIYHKERLEAMQAEVERLNDECSRFLGRFRLKGDDPFAQIRSAVGEYTQLTARIVAYRGELENRSVPLTENTAVGESLEEIDERRRLLELSRGEAQKKLGAFLRRREECDMALSERDTLSATLVELRESLAEAKETLRIVLLTQKYLTEAKDSITSKYLGKTKSSFNKYLRIIGDEEGEFTMDTSFGISKLDMGATRSPDAYSRGTKETYSLAARLALTDSLYEGERPFVILDDPFCSMDDGKIKRTLKMLESVAKEKQILYFTCSASRAVGE